MIKNLKAIKILLSDPSSWLSNIFDSWIGLDPDEPLISDDVASDISIYDKIKNVLSNFDLDQRLAPLLWAQAYHETGGFKSDIFKENNNLFGMKEPSKRETKATGTNRGHAIYNSVNDSILDMMFYFYQWKKKPTLTNFDNLNVNYYATWLKNNGYFEDSLENYKRGMLNALQKL